MSQKKFISEPYAKLLTQCVQAKESAADSHFSYFVAAKLGDAFVSSVTNMILRDGGQCWVENLCTML